MAAHLDYRRNCSTTPLFEPTTFDPNRRLTAVQTVELRAVVLEDLELLRKEVLENNKSGDSAFCHRSFQVLLNFFRAVNLTTLFRETAVLKSSESFHIWLLELLGFKLSMSRLCNMYVVLDPCWLWDIYFVQGYRPSKFYAENYKKLSRVAEPNT